MSIRKGLAGALVGLTLTCATIKYADLRFSSDFTNEELSDCSESMRRHMVTPAQLEGYGSQHSCEDRVKLRSAGITPQDAEKFNWNFRAKDILWFQDEGIKASYANRFNDRFYSGAIIQFSKLGIPEAPELANKYPESIDERTVVKLLEAGFTPQRYNAFDQSLSHDEIMSYLWADVSSASAQAYPGICSWQVKSYVTNNISYETVKPYYPQFGEPCQRNGADNLDVSHLVISNVSAQVAQSYGARSVADILLFQRRKKPISGEEVRTYPSHFDATDVIDLFDAGVSGEDATQLYNAIGEYNCERMQNAHYVKLFHTNDVTVEDLSLLSMISPDGYPRHKESKVHWRNRIGMPVPRPNAIKHPEEAAEFVIKFSKYTLREADRDFCTHYVQKCSTYLDDHGNLRRLHTYDDTISGNVRFELAEMGILGARANPYFKANARWQKPFTSDMIVEFIRQRVPVSQVSRDARALFMKK